MRVGVFGGAFNPPHRGHLELARAAHDQLGLEEVLLMPVGRPTHRDLEADPGGEARLRMCELLAAEEPWLSVSRAELDRPGPSWAVETLRELRDERPGDELVLLLGGDQAAALPGWREPDEVLSLAAVAVCRRGDHDERRVREALDGLDEPERVRFFELEPVDASSSEVRRRLMAGEPVDDLVPAAVAAEIAGQGLYQGAVTR